MGLKQDIQDGSRVALYGALAGAAAIVVVLLLGFMWVFGFGFFTDAAANRQGHTQQEQQINGNGSYRIAAYDHFFDACASVQTIEGRIEANKSELLSQPPPDAQRIEELRINITALTGQRAEAITHYNADARKSATLGQFRASDLPYQLDPTEDHTTCTAP